MSVPGDVQGGRARAGDAHFGCARGCRLGCACGIGMVQRKRKKHALHPSTRKKHASTSRTCPLLRGHCLACPVKAEREGVLISLRLCQLPRVSAPLTTHGEVVVCNGTRLAALQGRKAAQECQALALHAHYVEYPGASARVIESYCFASSESYCFASSVCCTVCCAAACGALTVASVMSCSSCIPAVLDTCLHTLPPSPYMSLRARAHAQARHAPFTG